MPPYSLLPTPNPFYPNKIWKNKNKLPLKSTHSIKAIKIFSFWILFQGKRKVFLEENKILCDYRRKKKKKRVFWEPLALCNPVVTKDFPLMEILLFFLFFLPSGEGKGFKVAYPFFFSSVSTFSFSYRILAYLLWALGIYYWKSIVWSSSFCLYTKSFRIDNGVLSIF